VKKIAFWAVVAALVIVPLLAWAANPVWGMFTLTPNQVAAISVEPAKPVKIDLTPNQLDLVKSRFPDFSGTTASIKFSHVFEVNKVLFTVKGGKLVSAPMEWKDLYKQ
jgi:hypothetical protein